MLVCVLDVDKATSHPNKASYDDVEFCFTFRTLKLSERVHCSSIILDGTFMSLYTFYILVKLRVSWVAQRLSGSLDPSITAAELRF